MLSIEAAIATLAAFESLLRVGETQRNEDFLGLRTFLRAFNK
jgi:hypothetical protein